MRWFDRAMIGALAAACIVLAVTFDRLGRNVADLDDRTVPTTIVEATPDAPPATTGDRCPNTFFVECP